MAIKDEHTIYVCLEAWRTKLGQSVSRPWGWDNDWRL